MRAGQDIYITLIQSTSIAFRKHKELMSYTDRSAHSNKATSYRCFRQYSNPGQDATGKNDTYGHPITTTLTILSQKIYCISHTPSLTLTGKWNHLRLCMQCSHIRKSVFRRLICKRQTTDSSYLLSVRVLLTSDYFVVSNEYASGKCIGVNVYILIRKCSGVKVGWNMKTQVKYKILPKNT